MLYVIYLVKKSDIIFHLIRKESTEKEKWAKWVGGWELRLTAIILVILGIAGNLYKEAHWGGAIAGILVASGVLYLNGVLLTLFVFVWALAVIVWLRISSNIENSGAFASFDNVTNATQENATQFT